MKVKNGFGEVFTAEQYVAGASLPKGAYLATVNEGDEADPYMVEKAFIATKDEDGDGNIDDAVSSIADGVYILTHEDGTVSLVHPMVFETDFTAVK